MINNLVTSKLQTVLHSQRTKKIALRCLIAVVIYGVLGFFVLPPLIKPVLVEKLGQASHRPVAIESLSINPFALSVTLEGVAIQEREGAEIFAGFDSLYLNLESSSLFRGGPVPVSYTHLARGHRFLPAFCRMCASRCVSSCESTD